MVVDDRVQVDVARSTLREQLGDLLLTGQVVQFQAHAGHRVCSSQVCNHRKQLHQHTLIKNDKNRQNWNKCQRFCTEFQCNVTIVSTITRSPRSSVSYPIPRPPSLKVSSTPSLRKFQVDPDSRRSVRHGLAQFPYTIGSLCLVFPVVQHTAYSLTTKREQSFWKWKTLTIKNNFTNSLLSCNAFYTKTYFGPTTELLIKY